jgi:hypothetical protein
MKLLQFRLSIISNKDLWKLTGQEDINLEIRKIKCRWIGHTLRKEDGEIPKAALLWNPQGNRKTEKQMEKIGNQGSG